MTDSFQMTPAAQRQEIRRLVEYAAERHRGDPYAGKRTSKRFRTPIHLDIASDLAETAKAAPATLHNISSTGLGFIGRTKLDPGSEVYIRESAADPPGPWIQCRVSHNTQGIRGYVIGVEFFHPIEELPGTTGTINLAGAASGSGGSKKRAKQVTGEKRGLLSWLGINRD